MNLISAAIAISATIQGPQPGRIHLVSDISHEFTFYMDGRFHRQYVGENGVGVQNWGTLWKLDLTSTNLLALAAGDPHVPYDPKSVTHVVEFVKEGGALLLLGDTKGWQTPGEHPAQAMGKPFGVTFSAVAALQPASQVDPSNKVTFQGGGTLELSSEWRPLVKDALGKPLLARRAFGKGNVLAGIRSLFGSHPDASDPINASWVKPLLVDLVKAKPVDPAQPPRGQFAELNKAVGPLTLEFHEGTKRFADDIAKEYAEIRPHLVAITGVEPAAGMITRMLMLPTGGGGFSSGERIAIGAWWGDYPKNRYPMVELIGHEAGHSWVLPYPEPVWNEPIATYLGIQVGKLMSLAEAQETLERAVERARKKDPEFKSVDITKPGADNAVVWGKSFWIFEQMEAQFGPGALAKYFRTKRSLLKPGRRGYSMDDCVAVWSKAVGKDLFPWFREHGMAVDATRTDLE